MRKKCESVLAGKRLTVSVEPLLESRGETCVDENLAEIRVLLSDELGERALAETLMHELLEAWMHDRGHAFASLNANRYDLFFMFDHLTMTNMCHDVSYTYQDVVKKMKLFETKPQKVR